MDTFESQITILREDLEVICKKIKNCRPPLSYIKEWDEETACEVQANMELSFRHAEDARMRLGKVFQAMDGGKSCCDK
jgi:hypothetical protein